VLLLQQQLEMPLDLQKKHKPAEINESSGMIMEIKANI
jgi:hypothetical protein